MHGEGVLTTDEGIYDGNFLDGEKIGQGTFTWTNGNKYDGEWFEDIM